MSFQKIFNSNPSTNQQLENYLCVTESSHQKGFHLAQEGGFIVVQPSRQLLCKYVCVEPIYTIDTPINVYSYKKVTSVFYGSVSFDPITLSPQK